MMRARRRLWTQTGGALVLAVAAGIMTALDRGWPAWILAGAAALLAIGRDFVISAREKALTVTASMADTPDGGRLRTVRAVRVAAADPLLLGIRAAEHPPQATKKAGKQHPGLPQYVHRDKHSYLFEQVLAARKRGGFVLLVGQPVAGKSRLAYEVVNKLVGRWRLRVPATLDELHSWTQNPRSLRRTVVWLEDLRPFLAGESGLTRRMLRDLVHSGHRVLVVGMIWTVTYNELIQLPETGSLDSYRHERELLTSTPSIIVANRFSTTERQEAWRVAASDEQIAKALEVTDFELPQVLAHVPQLMHRRLNTPDSYGHAVISAAVDASRVGIRGPVTASFLEDAAVGYLTADELAGAPARWFRTALKYATSPVGSPAAPVRSGRVKGTYLAAAYLRHHGKTAMQAAPPRPLWTACATHVTSAADLRQVGREAYSRGFEAEAQQAWTAAHRLGDAQSTVHLAELLIELDRSTDAETFLRQAIDVPAVRLLLGALLNEQGNLTEAREVWRAGTAAGDPAARRRLADDLVKSGDVNAAVDLWRAAISRGEPDGLTELADLLEEDGALDDAEKLWRLAVERDLSTGRSRLGALLSRRGRTDEARQVLSEAIAVADPYARVQLADLYLRLDDPVRAEAILRAGVSAGEMAARHHLAALLADWDRPDDALAMLESAPPTDHKSRQRLVDMLIAGKKLSQAEAVCRAGIVAGDPTSRIRLGDVLVALGRADDANREWRAAIAAGEPLGASQYADWLVGRDRLPEARRVLADAMEAGDHRARERLDELEFDGHRRGRGFMPPERQPR